MLQRAAFVAQALCGLPALLQRELLLHGVDVLLQVRIGHQLQALPECSNSFSQLHRLAQALSLLTQVLGAGKACLLFSQRSLELLDVVLQCVVALDGQTGGEVLDGLRQLARLLELMSALLVLLRLGQLATVVLKLSLEALRRIGGMLPVLRHFFQHRNGRAHVLGLLEVR